MITEDAFSYATTAESHYAKEDKKTMKVQRERRGSCCSGAFDQINDLQREPS